MQIRLKCDAVIWQDAVLKERQHSKEERKARHASALADLQEAAACQAECLAAEVHAGWSLCSVLLRRDGYEIAAAAHCTGAACCGSRPARWQQRCGSVAGSRPDNAAVLWYRRTC